METEESFEGWLAVALKPLMRRMLGRALATALADLKVEAERPAAARAAASGEQEMKHLRASA